MNINRHNYEEYFLLYTDNELSGVERQAVEQFIHENPDLERELTLLTQTTFRPDEDVVFENKALLMTPYPQDNFIDANNCEKLFIIYADDELTNNEKARVEQFVYDNPQYQELFELIQSVKLAPDSSITFPHKKLLYRHENHTRPVVFTWGRMAAAAVVLLFTGIIWLNNKSSSKGSDQIVKAEIKKTPEGGNTIRQKNPGQSGTDSNLAIQAPHVDPIKAHTENIIEAPDENMKKKKRELIAVKARRAGSNNINRSDSGNIISSVAKTVSEPKKPTDTQVGEIMKTGQETGEIASSRIKASELNSKTAGTLPMAKNDPGSTGKYASETVLPSSETDENVIFANIPVDRKNSLRGIFRKASRLIDKTTSYRPAKRSGLAIGNIEIAFQ